eukprot:1159839-Pelagomonas_calceolata.AAC.5
MVTHGGLCMGCEQTNADRNDAQGCAQRIWISLPSAHTHSCSRGAAPKDNKKALRKQARKFGEPRGMRSLAHSGSMLEFLKAARSILARLKTVSFVQRMHAEGVLCARSSVDLSTAPVRHLTGRVSSALLQHCLLRLVSIPFTDTSILSSLKNDTQEAQACPI